ncbi:LuxR C-terminal-related transcriptional regulator [Streptomyces sp. NPDC087440]|uniref:LuxR C-terminal-related transcriptional regulator n=1 Tax=Streptomyces sp. NPDC087440 TaxID=3365790 RepID=UPI003820DDB2
MLEVLGLAPHVEAVYRGMLDFSAEGVVELSTRLGLKESEVRDGLDTLVEMELLKPSRDAPGSLRVVSVQRGIEVLLRRQEEALIRRQADLARSKAAAAGAVREYAALRPNTVSDGTERLVGLDAIQARLETLTCELGEECLSIMPGGAQSKESLEASRPLDEEAMSRGVRMLAVYQESARNDSATLGYARWTAERGGQVRTSPLLPPRLLIFDRTVAVVPIDPANSRLGALCTRAPGIVASLVALFEQTWAAAVPFGTDLEPVPEGGLSPTERELLKLLGCGMTDEAAGKKLGISLRTVRRQMSGLMERLHASSRFEAGLKAAQSGWL